MTTQNLIDIIGSRSDLNTLNVLVKSVPGLEDKLASAQNSLTFLAPTDEAIEKFKKDSPGTMDNLLGNPGSELKFFLYSHILEGSLNFENILERYRNLTYELLHNAPTRNPLNSTIVANNGLRNLNGAPISIELRRRELYLSSNSTSMAKVIQVDISAKNGRIHLLNEVIHFN